MKKFLICLFLLAGVCCYAGARSKTADSTSLEVNYNPYKYGVRVGISGAPVVFGLMTGVSGGMIRGWSYRTPDNVKEFYNDSYGNLYTSGNVGAEFDWALKKWVTLSAGAYFTGFWAQRYEGVSGKPMRNDSGIAVSVLGTVRFTYINRKYFQMYSGIALGAFLIGDNTGEFGGMFHFQPIPLGFSFGRKVFGFAEIGLGTLYMGGNVGIGYRF